MNEDFLHFVWKHRLFDPAGMQTTNGVPVKVLATGMLNTDAGPDFFNARIQLDDTVWAGNIEIHQKASDWYRHKHELDAAYDNVILHVVCADDQIVKNSKGQPVMNLVLPYHKQLESNYSDLLRSKGWIACADRFHRMDEMTMQIWYHSLMVERLQQKTAEIIQRLAQNKNDWNETFYQFLARNFGFKTNSLPFELLAKAVPLHVLAKHKNDLFQIESLLFGTSGLLNEELIGDDYFLALRNEYAHLYKKYKLKPVEGHLWKFLRLRPVNFPTIRIAQFARLIHQSSSLFSKLMELSDLSEIKKLFMVQASDYWVTHYRFNKASATRVKLLGDSSFYNIVTNTLVPFLFVYGDHHNRQDLKDLSLEYLEQLPAEHNSIVANWVKTGARVHSAFDTQALIQLKNNYCNHKNCLHCTVGTKLISTGDREVEKTTSQG
ncbi:DUF2851 family protein [Gaoshiqia sp. Z1-71]|uniref:DUF2851 family protein n=1 Tax=Gaoshiqia hydrogeniformans TaxID=3290090 RepID=UPI003BF7F333